MLKSDPGTYAISLHSNSNETIQVGRWGQLGLQPGYYVYVGSALGPGGLRARVSRHLRTDKRMRWHIDYLHEHVTPVEVWFSYEAKLLEHEWAGVFLGMPELISIKGFGCSDCKCYSHLFHTLAKPVSTWIKGCESLDCSGFNKSV